MNKMIKESVAILFCHAIKMSDKELKVEKPLFCKFMREEFDCNSQEAEELLEKNMEENHDNIDTHISIISNALYNEPFLKMNLLKELNHIIFRSKIEDEDYEFFDKVKNSFFKR